MQVTVLLPAVIVVTRLPFLPHSLPLLRDSFTAEMDNWFAMNVKVNQEDSHSVNTANITMRGNWDVTLFVSLINMD